MLLLIKKKTKALLAAIIFCVLFAGVFFAFNINRGKKVCFGGNCFLVELAQTQEEIELGLMYKESLAQNRGMLFIFKTRGVYNFWMKNTKIPLDIIWINNKKEVIFIKNSAQPCGRDFCPLIEPGAEANYVLEVNAGLAEKIRLKAGSQLIFRNF
ncbi:MAG: DUF192 domain-containing protein [Patescibacteria group bacterium]